MATSGTASLGKITFPIAPLPTPQGYTWENEYADIVQCLSHEPLEDYVKGGYHPVALGDTFRSGRYTVRHKLGFGGHSTVWLARDSREEYVHASG